MYQDINKTTNHAEDQRPQQYCAFSGFNIIYVIFKMEDRYQLINVKIIHLGIGLSNENGPLIIVAALTAQGSVHEPVGIQVNISCSLNDIFPVFFLTNQII